MSEQPSNSNLQLALVPVPVPVPQDRVKGKHSWRRPLKKSRRVRQCTLAFNLVKAPENEVTYVLKLDKVNGIPMEETETPEESSMEKLPVTNLLKHWNLEVRRRHTNRWLDRVYSHPRSPRTYRSLVEVCKFIGENYRRPELLKVRHEKKKLPLQSMYIVAANNEAEMAEILNIDLNVEPTESDDHIRAGILNIDLIAEAMECDHPNSAEMLSIDINVEAKESEENIARQMLSGDNSGNKVAEIPIVPKEEKIELDIGLGISTGNSNNKGDVLGVPKVEDGNMIRCKFFTEKDGMSMANYL